MPTLINPQTAAPVASLTGKKLNIGLYGFGCVGQGLYGVLNDTPGIRVGIGQIVVKNPNKRRNLPAHQFAFSPDAIRNNPSIDAVVELIDHADDAFEIVQQALRKGQSVVSANKKMIAEHLPELVALQAEHGGAFLYEASCAGSIPIIRNLEEYYDNDFIDRLQGILNGTCNYILTRMFQEGADFNTVLTDAQRLGFAESDPTLDIDGFDPKYKLCILTLHAFGLFRKPEEVLNLGIRQVTAHDLQFAREKGYKLQLVATSQKVNQNQLVSYVLPHFIPEKHLLYNVSQEYNGVIVQTAFAEQQFFMGKGAGGYPTASAVLSDIAALTYNYRYEYKKVYQQLKLEALAQYPLHVYIRYGHGSPIFERLPVHNLEARYEAGDFNYVIGTVDLQDLHREQAWLRQNDVFIAVL
jgi:homoserine dehydrogenase